MTEAAAEGVPRGDRAKILILSIAVLAIIAVVAGLTAFLGRSTKRAGISGGFTVAAGELTYRSTVQGPDFGKVVEVGSKAAANAVPVVSNVPCERSYTASRVLLCLQSEGNLISQPYAEIYDSSLKQTKKLAITGTPNRARLSADGRMASWTTFVTGDSYTQPGASTRTSILDLKTGEYVDSLENFNAYVDGNLYKAVDVNFWGVTFAADDTFYATMGSSGKTWLMKGDFRAHSLRSLRQNVECPSLSPDGTRIVFKKRVSDDIRHPWRFTVLNLATLQETPLAETRSVDDQAAWLDNGTVMYAVPHDDDPGSDLYAVPADGSGTPRLLAANGMSPSVTSG